MITRIQLALAAIFAFLICLPGTLADGNTTNSTGPRYVRITNAQGQTTYVPDNRRPSLYTQDFGDCLGNSAINLTSFDAAYYKDNMTILFHFAGNSGLNNASLMMFIGVYAYGESRFNLIFNPCSANINSLCPLNDNVTIEAAGIIPVNQQDVSGIPTLAYAIPDFEGQAILRVFDNATEQEIACYSGVITNGHSFSQPASVGTVLGVFTLITLLASFATAIYGEAVPTMRLHYAHSLSVGVVMSVFQHIFFTGALSVNWPSVLVAWWSNFAWSGGMIYSSSMQKSINHLIGNNVGNTTEVGAAQSGSTQPTLGGGYDISAIYKRSFPREPLSWIPRKFHAEHLFEQALSKRDAASASSSISGTSWYGSLVGPGFPLPGNYSGFAGTLAEENILVSNAFMTGFLWFLILLVILVAAVVALKWTLEGLIKIKCLKQTRLKFFRDHWLGYTTLVALRTCLIAFFMIMFLTIFQFTYSSSGGVKGIAAIIFIIFFVGIFSAAAYAVFYKEKTIGPTIHPQTEKKSRFGKLPWSRVKAGEAQPEASQVPPDSKSSAHPFWKRMGSSGSVPAQEGQSPNIHDSDDYTIKFGWLAARFRRSRWWFFAAWIVYEFVRACFYAGASGNVMAQVFGLLAVEIVAFAFIVWARPFEGQRLNLLVVYCLGFSKVATVALSAAFDVRFNLSRIITTVIGIVIIVIQGILTIITLIAMIVGAISSYMSISRNQEDFRPRKMHGLREKYFDHLDRAVDDLPRGPKEKKPKEKKSKEKKVAVVEEEIQPGFEMKNVRRLAKIEDEDEEIMANRNASYVSLPRASQGGKSVRNSIQTLPDTPTRSRAPSIASFSVSSLPYGARPHRMSWSNRDLDAALSSEREAQEHWASVDVSRATPLHSRDPSRNGPAPTTATSSQQIKPQASIDNLSVGGDVSTRDTIGKVPVPTVRPRSGTHGSRHSRQSFTGFNLEASKSNDHLVPSDSRDQPGPSKRASLTFRSQPILTPALEMDEWGVALTPKNSR